MQVRALLNQLGGIISHHTLSTGKAFPSVCIEYHCKVTKNKLGDNISKITLINLIKRLASRKVII